MKVYISIPIAGRDIAAQRKTAAEVAKSLKVCGHEPLNPFCNGLPEDAPRAEHMRKDLRMLLRCDAIVLCPGWKYSEGCLLECSVAKQCGMAITYADHPFDELASQLQNVRIQHKADSLAVASELWHRMYKEGGAQ